MSQVRTSRGQLAENEEVVANLLASVEHLLDIPQEKLTPEDIICIDDIRKLRNDLIKNYAKEDEINIEFHCTYKHLLLARMQLRELIQAKADEDPTELSNLQEKLGLLEAILGYVRARYLNIDISKLDDPMCIRCVEDYLSGRSKP